MVEHLDYPLFVGLGTIIGAVACGALLVWYFIATTNEDHYYNRISSRQRDREDTIYLIGSFIGAGLMLGAVMAFCLVNKCSPWSLWRQLGQGFSWEILAFATFSSIAPLFAAFFAYVAFSCTRPVKHKEAA